MKLEEKNGERERERESDFHPKRVYILYRPIFVDFNPTQHLSISSLLFLAITTYTAIDD